MKVDLILTATRDTINRIASGEKKAEYRADSNFYAQRFFIFDKKGEIVDVKPIRTVKLHDQHDMFVVFNVKDMYFCTFKETPLPEELKELENDKNFTGCYVIEVERVLDSYPKY